MTLPDVLPSVSYHSKRFRQREGLKPVEQCSRHFKHQRGSELGLNDMVNESELLINAVIANKPKMLTGLNQNGKWSRLRATISLNVDIAPSAKRQDLTHSGIYAERGNPVIFLAKGKQAVRQADEIAGIGYGRKQMPFCNETDTGLYPTRKRADFPLVSTNERTRRTDFRRTSK